MVDWTNPNCQVTSHFKVKELIFLPSWNRLANEQDGLNDQIKSNLILLANKMEEVRHYFNTGINVHVTYRPEEYNKLIGGAKNSAHKIGLAMDFNVIGIDCNRAREIILKDNMLEIWDMRMENRPNSNWIHLGSDWKYPMSRYFLP